jgi:hypothetical protein
MTNIGFRPFHWLRASAATMLAVAGVLSAPPHASADIVTEGALRAMAAAIDASPDWSATFQTVTSDASGAGVLTGLRIESAVAGMTIDIDRLTVTRGSAGADGRYAASKVAAGNVVLAAGPLGITLANVTLDDFSVPPGVGFAYDPEKPFSSIVQAYGMAAKSRVGQGRVGSLALTESLAGSTSRVIYNDVLLTRLDNGKIATLSAGPLTAETPVADKANPKPLVTMAVARADVRDLDLAALLRVYDAVPAGGSRGWQPAVANATYRDATISVPGITIKLGTVAMDDFKVRPPERPLAPDLDRAVSKPFEEGVSSDPAGILNLLSAYSIGRFSASPVDVNAVGIDKIHLDGLTMANLSLDGLGEFALAGLQAGVHDLATLKAGRIAIGGARLPKPDVLAASIRTALSGGDVDLSTLIPAIGFLELAGLDLNVTGYPSTSLGRVRVDLGGHFGNLPTTFKVAVADADLDAVLMPGSLREILTRYGYTRVRTDVAGNVTWNEQRKQTTLDGVKVTAKDVGTLTVDATLNGPERADIDALDSLDSFAAFAGKLALVNATVSFKDDSIVGRVLNDQAKGVKVDPERFRDQFARGLPFMLLPVGTSDFQRKASPVFQEFIRTPGTLTFTASPAMPLALPALIAAAQSSGVFNLPTMLNLNVSGTPGPKPPSAPAAAPVTPVTPASPPGAPNGGSGDIRGTVPAPN